MSEAKAAHEPFPEDCTGCNSTGKQHPDCPDCKCKCERCGGKGWVMPKCGGREDVSTPLRVGERHRSILREMFPDALARKEAP